jgi:20S proteasome alpha/beta subunit
MISLQMLFFFYFSSLFLSSSESRTTSSNNNIFAADGSLKQIVNGQKVVVSNVNEETSFAIQINSSCCIFGLKKNLDSLSMIDEINLDEDSANITNILDANCTTVNSAHSSSINSSYSTVEDVLMNKNGLSIAVVGHLADRQSIKVMIEKLNREHYIQHNDCLSGDKLALYLANFIHKISLNPNDRLYAFNALIISKAKPCVVTSGKGGEEILFPMQKSDIFKVDLSGNYFKCKLASIGFYSGILDQWLETRGLFLCENILSSKIQVDASIDLQENNSSNLHYSGNSMSSNANVML